MKHETHNSFDILIIGGGHAGAEAAWAASRMLAAAGGGGGTAGRVAMVTMDPLAIGRMSCNPAIGGLAKGQMVREIDALGGLMAHAIDATGIQFRMLNRSKGPAVQSPRSGRQIQIRRQSPAASSRKLPQPDDPHRHRRPLPHEWSPGSQSSPGWKSGAFAILTRETRISGVTLEDGRTLACRCVVVTTGTFLRALMHTGERKTEGGRVGEQTARGLSASLREMGFELGRLKTGTPPRLAKETIDFSGLEEQPGDDPPIPFSDLTQPGPFQISEFRIQNFPPLPQLPMHITHTNARVHEIIRANLHRAPMYSGQIQSRGPRYCPSIEDKVVRFADKEHHQIFLEPEGLDTNEIYCNGISTSLPEDVQQELVHSIKGLERARILRPGYAVEYDFSPTHQIDASLETRLVDGLFFAGQLNGTSGYEEAAGQGLMAGINAARKVLGQQRMILTRDQAYIGVMIDDLVTKTPTEPYRMFTSRAEFRLTLRSDNTDQRLTPLAAQLGLATPERVQRLAQKLAAMTQLTDHLKSTRLPIGLSGTTAYDFLRRPEITAQQVAALLPPSLHNSVLSPQSSALIWSQVEIEAKYAGYIEREKDSARRMRNLESKTIPEQFNFAAIAELRHEARQCLGKFRPQTLGQASRLEGVTPNDLTVLMLHLHGKRTSRV